MPCVFVYGALMGHPEVLRRGRAASLAGYAVRFCHRGMRGVEPRFLGLVEAPGEEAHGVLVDLGERAWARMSRHELGYALREVRARTAEGERAAWALVLQPEATVPVGWPSARYGRLVGAAAAHHGLPRAVVERYREAAARGPRLTLYLGPLMHVVRWFVPILGGEAAFVVVVATALVLALASLAGLAALLRSLPELL